MPLFNRTPENKPLRHRRKSTKERKWLTKINVLMGLFIFHSTLYTYASPASDAPTIKATQLLTKAQQEGQIRVIVTLKIPKKIPIGSAVQDTTQDNDKRTQAITHTQERVIKRLQAKKEKIFAISRYRFTPQMALSVTKAGLKSLMFDPHVTHIHEDLLIQGTVGQSVPKIFPSYLSSAYSGEGWTVAILDTGVDKFHPAFGNRVIDEACYSSNANFSNYHSLCPNSTPDAPIKASTTTGSGIDCQEQLDNLKSLLRIPNSNGTGCTHGTGVAGVAAGNFGNTQGVARDANIMAIQVFTAVQSDNNTPNNSNDDTLSVGAFSSDILKGLEHVYALRNTHKIAAANISIGGLDASRNAINTESLCDSGVDRNGLGTSATLRPIIQLLKQAGIATVIASGNNDVENGVGTYACIREAIAVGATDDNDNKYDVCNHNLQLSLHDSPATAFNGTNDPRSYPTRNCGSNSGDLLDLWAPGVAIETALATSAGGGTEINSGTSEAAPHVAGAWAVMKQKNPDATVDVIENAFKTTGQPITVAGVTRQRINIDEALLKIGNTTPPTEDNPSGIIDACQQGQTPVGNDYLTVNTPICLQGATSRYQRQMSFYVEAEKAGLTLEIQLSHGSGNGILLHRYDNRPRRTVYDNISDNAGNEEKILVNNVQEGWNYVHVQTESEFSGVTLQLRYLEDNIDDSGDTSPPNDPSSSDLVNTCQQGQTPVGNVYLATNTPICLQGATSRYQRQMSFYVEAEKAGLTLEIQLAHGSGNGILLHRYDNRPTRTVYDNISDNAGNEERILVNNVQEGWNYVHVQTESEFSGVTLRVRYRLD